MEIVIFCLALSIAMMTLGLLAPRADSASACAALEVGSVHTLAPSFHHMPALPQSAFVSGWLDVSAVDTVGDSVCPAVEVGSVHTLAPSFHHMPALLQSALVSGWKEVSDASASQGKNRSYGFHGLCP
jgi:hypothetical protein